MIYKTFQKVSNVCQLLDKRKFLATQTKAGVTVTNNNDGTLTISGTSTAFTYINFGLYPKENNGHTLLLRGADSSASVDRYFLELLNQNNANDYGNGVILKTNALNPTVWGIVFKNNVTFNNIILKPQIFDLTEMYGAGHEPTTVEQFRQDFPEEMYDYSPHCFVKSYRTLLKATDNKIITSYKKSLVCKTKNLFPTSTAVGTLGGWNQSTARQFEEDKWYIGISGSNYYIPSSISEYKLTENYVYINTKGSGYGIGRAFKCEPNQTYTISCKWVENTNYMQISIGFYDGNGNYLSYNAAANLAERYTVTIPANCKWFTVCFVGNSSGSSYVYNIQLELGDTATDYVPYGYL